MTKGTEPRRVIIERPDGARYGVTTAEKARKLYPDATIVSYYDGTPYETEEKPQAARATAPAKPRAARPKRSRAKAPAAVPAVSRSTPDTADTIVGESADGAPDQS